MWHYWGDANVEYGGVWYNLDNWQWGYVDAVRVEDLGSACGFRGAVLIEKLTINVGAGWSKNKKRAKGVLASCSWQVLTGAGIQRKLSLAEAYLGYGHYDLDDYPPSETLQLEEDGPLCFEGWTATRFKGDLRVYVEENYLD